jgi:hypothetical protein
MNSSSAEALFQKLARYANDYKKAKCYWVYIPAHSVPPIPEHSVPPIPEQSVPLFNKI